MLFGCAAPVEAYDKVVQAGFDYIELPCRSIAAMTEGEFANALAVVQNGPIPAYAMNIYCPGEVIIAGPGFDCEAARRYAEKAAGRAKALGVRLVGVGSPNSRRLPAGFDPALALVQLREFLTCTADAFGQAGITVCLEALGPCYCNFINRLEEAVQVVRELNHPHLAVVLDLYNMEHAGEADRALDDCIDLVAHAHTSDDEGNPGKRSYLRKDKEALHRQRIARLQHSGYTGGLTLEIDVSVEVEPARRSLELFRSATGQ